MGKLLLFLPCLPAAVVVWPLGLLSMLGFTCKPRWEEFGVLSLEWRPWLSGKIDYSITLARLIIYEQGARDDDAIVDTRPERHEHVHIKQTEDNMLISMLLGALVALDTHQWWLAYEVWSSGALWILFSYVTSLLRYGFAKSAYGDGLWYRWAEPERSAYAQTNLPQKVGMSWQQFDEWIENLGGK